MNKTWNKSNPSENGGYICRMNNAYIKMCYWNGSEWFDMWEPTLEGIVVEWMRIPYDELLTVACMGSGVKTHPNYKLITNLKNKKQCLN